MARHAPMHVNPGNPMWRRVPLAVACFLVAMMGVLSFVAANGDAPAWAGVVILTPAAALWGYGYFRIRKEQRNG